MKINTLITIASFFIILSLGLLIGRFISIRIQMNNIYFTIFLSLFVVYIIMVIIQIAFKIFKKLSKIE